MAYLIICLFFGLAGGIVGWMKGSSFVLWFLISALVPVFGTDEVRRQCPRCGRIVKLYDQVCMSCGEDLEFPDRAIEPESAVIARR